MEANPDHPIQSFFPREFWARQEDGISFWVQNRAKHSAYPIAAPFMVSYIDKHIDDMFFCQEVVSAVD
jgi:hypothetical protein